MPTNATQTEHTDTDPLRQVRRVLQVARWLVIAGVIAASELQYTTARVNRLDVFISAAAVAVLTLIVGLAQTKWRRFRVPVVLTIVDVAMVSLIVLFSDGIQSPFYALFYITLIEAAASFGMRGALYCAAVIAVLSFLAEAADTTQALTEPRVLEDMVRTLPYLFLIAIITGTLRDRITALADSAATMRTRQEAVEREMALARQVQMAQLPTEIPSGSGLEIGVIYKPAREVGGDLYDFYPVSDGQLGITVADVSGKGVPAALLVSSAKYAVRNSYSEDRAAMMREVNKQIASVTGDDNFVTMLHGVVDTVAMDFRYVNAGHMPPMVVDADTGEVACHGYSDAPLGVLEPAQFTEQRIALKPGDTLVLYSDGTTDALASGGDGLTRFAEALGGLNSADMPAWREKLLSMIQEPHKVDDITVVAVRIRQTPAEWTV